MTKRKTKPKTKKKSNRRPLKVEFLTERPIGRSPIDLSKKKRSKKRGKDLKPRKKRGSAKKKSAVQQEAVTRSPVQVTPFPRAGDNKEFEDLTAQAIPPDEPVSQVADQKETAEPELLTKDVAEWVSYPFAIWAQTQGLPGLKISDKEAMAIGEPLTRILNRHSVGGVIPPDALDGLLILGRTTPVIKTRFDVVKAERSRRQSHPTGTTPGHGGLGGGAPQGIPRED